MEELTGNDRTRTVHVVYEVHLRAVAVSLGKVQDITETGQNQNRARGLL